MEELRIEIKRIKNKIHECDYWINSCEKDLKDMSFSNLSSYRGCKIVLSKNKESKEEFEKKLDILSKAYEILKGERND